MIFAIEKFVPPHVLKEGMHLDLINAIRSKPKAGVGVAIQQSADERNNFRRKISWKAQRPTFDFVVYLFAISRIERGATAEDFVEQNSEGP